MAPDGMLDPVADLDVGYMHGPHRREIYIIYAGYFHTISLLWLVFFFVQIVAQL